MYPARNLQAVNKQNQLWTSQVLKLNGLHIHEALWLSLMDNTAHFMYFLPLSMSLQSQISCDLLYGMQWMLVRHIEEQNNNN